MALTYFTRKNSTRLTQKLSVPLLSTAVGMMALTALPTHVHALNPTAVGWDLPSDKAENQWKSFETDHFVLNFLAKHQVQAERSATIAEEAWDRLTKELGWTPKDKVQIVIVDDFDLSNGWAHPEPFNQIRVYLSPPDGGSTLESYDDWLNLLIPHELTHIIHIDMVHGIPADVRSVLGRHSLTFPHAFQPSFLIEGLAVYKETDFEMGFGRGQSYGYDMMMRMEVLNGLDSIDEVANAMRDWPLGKQYLYGYYYFQYLADTYGDEKIKKYLIEYSRNIIPALFLNYDADTIFGKSHSAMWPDFQKWLTAKFEPVIQKIQQEGETPLVNISNDGLSLDPSSTDGQHYYFLRRNGEDRQAIIKRETTGNEVILDEVQGMLNMDVDTEGNVVYSRLVSRQDGRYWADLFTLVDGETQRITEQQRYRDARWLTAQNQSKFIIAKSLKDSISRLDLLNDKGEYVETLWQGSINDILGEFAISKDGLKIVATVKRSLQGWNLETFDIATKKWQQITDTKAIENGAIFVDEGQSVLYSADYHGIYNLYQLDLDSKEVSQLSNLMGGAFQPLKIDNQIYLQNYTADGYQHSQLQNDPSQNIQSHNTRPLSTQPIKNFKGQYNYPDPYKNMVEHSPVKNYSPWSTLAPQSWLPILGGDKHSTFIGLSTNGQDALGRHIYAVSAAYDIENNIGNGNLTYFYNNQWQLTTGRSHKYIEHKSPNPVFEDDLQVRQSDVMELARINLFNSFENRLQFTAGVHSDQEKDIKTTDANNKDSIIFHKSSKEGLVGIRADFSNAEGYLFTPGASWGQALSFVWESNNMIDSDFKGDVFNLNASAYFDLPARNVIAITSFNGYGEKGSKPFTMGGNGILTPETLFGRNEWSLRGYSEFVQTGNRINVNSIEFRSHLASVERGLWLLPVGIGEITSSVFVDHGAAWNPDRKKNILNSHRANYLTSAGIELGVEVILLYGFSLPMSVGYAHGFDKNKGEDEVYLSTSYHF